MIPDLSLMEVSYRDGRLTPIDVLAECLDRIARMNGAINAVIALDCDGAERATEESADRWRRGAPRSPVDGAAMLVKANLAVAGLPWHAGIAAYGDRIADADAPAVARLRRAGAVILGLTNMDEGALGATGDNAWLGRVGNPCRPGCSAGGSSGGSAAAVAAGFCIAALGSDTIGSIAIPAAYCGVVGHRASRYLMPVDGMVPLSPTFDHGGWHASSIRAAMALHDAIGNADAAGGPFRIAALDVDAPLAAPFDRARCKGWQVDRVKLPVDLGNIARRMFEVAEAESAAIHADALRQRPDGFSPGLRRMLEWGATAGRARLAGNLVALRQAGSEVRTALMRYDALLMPATPHDAPAAGSPPPPDQSMFAALPACLGWPATTIPAPKEGGPALLITAPSDDVCLSIAAGLS